LKNGQNFVRIFISALTGVTTLLLLQTSRVPKCMNTRKVKCHISTHDVVEVHSSAVEGT